MATLQEIIAEEWRSRATELADWAMEHLVNRRDVWGQYAVLTPSERRTAKRPYKAMTLPAVDQRDVSAKRVTLDKLTRHFASRRHHRPQLIGLHAKSKEGTSRWFGIDVDNHADDADSSDDLARRNLNACVAWRRNLQRRGLDPLLLDSNGAGGYHLWVLLREPVPTEKVHAFAMALTADWDSHQLDRQPETFPKRVKRGSLGSWFRLPGLHHTRDHHARVWQDDDGLDDPWLAGHAAIDAMLNASPGWLPGTGKQAPGHDVDEATRAIAAERADITDSVDIDNESTMPAPGGARERQPSSRKRSKVRATTRTAPRDAAPGDPAPVSRGRQFERTARPTVCIDLDGVLAARTHNASLGAPVDGAVEFTREIHQLADIVIHTARFSTRRGERRSASAVERLQERIERWLDRHGFAWDRVNTQVAKPIAVAYVDDRAVVCQPESDGLKAFDQALIATRALADGKSH